MRFLRALSVLLCCSLSSPQTLDPGGRNVCKDSRDSSSLVCCAGWAQQGTKCTKPVCEGEQACLQNEICVYPGVCRCPPGYYGAQCKTRCPLEFWASDCRQVCPCYPHGHCNPVTGECTCNPTRWGPLCQHTCRCSRNGHCHPVNGNCICEEGWWAPTCSKPCQCSGEGSVGSCDPLTGRCQCRKGYWGMKCLARCNCNQSPCNERNGVCECEAGSWGSGCERKCTCDLSHGSCDPASGRCVCHSGYMGASCNYPCESGHYGVDCKLRCGYCRDNQPCSSTDGACAACEPGWNGTRCDLTCTFGFFGEGCKNRCPRCRENESCDPKTGMCWRCDPGWTGPRCEDPCSDRRYGDACHFLCSPCFQGSCHHVTGRCVCQPGFQGESCNSTCPRPMFGLNCSSVCDCGEGVGCHPVSGACPYSGRGAVLAGVLIPLLLLLFAVLCCCLCCGGGPTDDKNSAAVADGGLLVRMKYHVYSVLANISAALPCMSDWSSGLPRVTVSHHDPEVTFNHSFIEPPSSGWVTEGSSFDSDEEEGEALYCVPPREDIEAVAGGDFQEMSSKCNMFLDPSGFSYEDITSPFNIPRTSSIAKSKRPSVSFAEGTCFSPKERRGSGQDSAAPPRSKAKTPWGVLMLSALQSQVGTDRTGEEDGVEEDREDGEEGNIREDHKSTCEVADQEADRNPSYANLQVPGMSGRRRTMSNTAAHKGTPPPSCDGEVGASHKVTTVYVTVGKTGRPLTRTEPSSEGPVQAMLRRLGSLQRQKEQDRGRSKSKAAEGITKPPRRKLGARATVWEQGGPSGGEAKPVRRKNTRSEPPPSEENAPKRPLSSILKSVPETATADGGSGPTPEGGAMQGADAAAGQTESSYLTVGPAGEATQIFPNLGGANSESCYENVLISQP